MGLELAKKEIIKALHQAEKLLQNYIQSRDMTSFRQYLTLIHHVHGSLQIIACPPLEHFTSALEEASQSLLIGKEEPTDHILDVLLRAIKHVSILLTHKADMDEIILSAQNSLLKELKGAVDTGSAGESENLTTILKKIYHLFHGAVLNVFRQEKVKENIIYLDKALVRLESLSNGASSAMAALWELSLIWINSLDEASISKVDQSLLTQLDEIIKSVLERESLSADYELVKIFFLELLARMSGEAGMAARIVEVDRKFQAGCDELYKNNKHRETSLLNKVGIENAIHKSNQQVQALKNSIESFLETDQTQHLKLESAQLASQYLVIATGELQQFNLQIEVKRIFESISQMFADKVRFASEELDEIASVVLKIESSLMYLADASFLSEPVSLDMANRIFLLAKAETLKKCHEELQLIKDAIVMCMSSPSSSSSAFALVPEQLQRIIGAMLMIELSRCAHLTEQYLRIIRQLVNGQAPLTSAPWELLADVIAGIDYYFECVLLNQEAALKVLEIVENKINDLQFIGRNVEETNVVDAVISQFVSDKRECVEKKTEEIESMEITENNVEQNLVNNEVLEIFFEELGELHLVLCTSFSRWQEFNHDMVAMKEMRCTFHTLKGSGRMAGAFLIGEIAWCCERLLDRLINRSIPLTQDIVHTLKLVIQAIPQLLSNFQKQNPISTDLQQLHDRIQALLSNKITTIDEDANNGDKISLADNIPKMESISERGEVDRESLPNTVANETPEYAIEIATQPDRVLLKIFIEEALSHLKLIENFLQDSSSEREVDEILLRSLHTLKGSASMANVNGVSSLIKPIERLIKVMSLRRLPLSLELQEFLADVVTSLKNLFPDLLNNPEAMIDEQGGMLYRLLGFYKQYFGVDSFENDLEKASFISSGASFHSLLLSQDIDALQDAENLLVQLQHNPYDCVAASQSLRRALQNVAEKSISYEQPKIAALCDLLKQCHGKLQQKTSIDVGVLHWMQEGHLSLLDLLDALAAGQSLMFPDEVMIHLKNFVEGQHDAIGAILINQRGEDKLKNSLAENGSMELNETKSSVEKVRPVELVHASAEIVNANKEAVFGESVGRATTDSSSLKEQDGLVDAELLEIFIEEASDIIEGMQGLLNHWLNEPGNLLNIEVLQSELHTLKGGARLSRLNDFAEFSENLEVFYEAIGDGRVGFSTELSAFLQGCHHQLMILLQQLRQNNLVKPTKNILQEINYFTSDAYQSKVRNQSRVDAQKSNYQSKKEESIPVIPLNAQQDHILKTDLQHSSIENDNKKNLIAEDVQNPEVFEVKKTLDFSEDVAWLFGAEFDREIFEIFREEGHELLEKLDHSLHEWISDPSGSEYLQIMQRTLHTLKGSARLAGLTHLGDLAHDFESFLNVSNPDSYFFRQAQQRYDAIDHAIKNLELAQELGPEGYAKKVLGSLTKEIPDEKKLDAGNVVVENFLSDIDENFQNHTSTGDQASKVELMADHDSIVQKENVVSTPSLSPSAINKELLSQNDSSFKVLPYAPPVKGRKFGYMTRYSDRTFQQEMVKVHGSLLEKLLNLAGETTIATGRIETQVTSFARTLNDLTGTIAKVTDLLRRLDLETEAHMAYRYENQLSGYEEFDPLEMDRYSMLHQLSRSLAESASDIADLKDTLSNNIRDTESLLMQQARINTQLQEGLMRTQLVPFGRLLPRLRRMVRQTSDELSKQVNFEVVNAEGEMDRNVLERMVAPLEHMLRNSVDHGIESPAHRLEVGKSAEGRITLLLTREGGEVVLRLSDDGRGMQLESIKRQAIVSGLMKADAELSENDILQFVFKPGFSTAEKVTQISGRGVGMDVVYSEIKQLGGSMKIHSALGVGTQFTIRLPFTVAITRALMVSVGDDSYAIPLNNIEGVVRVSPYELMNYYRDNNSQKFAYADRQYRVQYLGAYVQGVNFPSLSGLEKPIPILLVRSGSSAVALQVDALIGSREVVVKSLGPQLSAVSGFSGATILGDGSVVIILDVVALLRAERAGRGVMSLRSEHTLDTNKPLRATPLVMVVDDSVTVRKVTSRLLERHGLDVMVAIDGVDAMTKLQDVSPDLILLDIEMPRMDGFEVASQVRHNQRLQSVPIIMITSRTGEKHRSRAYSLGVNNFMGKPYQETHLVEAIQAILGKEIVKL